jgi:hypothetical protein
VGDKEWFCIFPEGKRLCTLQGNTFSAAHQPDTQLRKRVGADCVKESQTGNACLSAINSNSPKTDADSVIGNHFLPNLYLNPTTSVAQIFSMCLGIHHCLAFSTLTFLKVGIIF